MGAENPRSLPSSPLPEVHTSLLPMLFLQSSSLLLSWIPRNGGAGNALTPRGAAYLRVAKTLACRCYQLSPHEGKNLAWPAGEHIIDLSAGMRAVAGYSTASNGEAMRSRSASIRMASPQLSKWSVLVLLVAVAGFLAFELVCGPRTASGQASQAQSGGVLAVAGRIAADTYGLYLVDREQGTIVVYRWAPGKPDKLKLAAARNCTFDLQLDEYNTEPSPAEIRSLVREGKGLGSESP